MSARRSVYGLGVLCGLGVLVVGALLPLSASAFRLGGAKKYRHPLSRASHLWKRFRDGGKQHLADTAPVYKALDELLAADQPIAADFIDKLNTAVTHGHTNASDVRALSKILETGIHDALESQRKRYAGVEGDGVGAAQEAQRTFDRVSPLLEAAEQLEAHMHGARAIPRSRAKHQILLDNLAREVDPESMQDALVAARRFRGADDPLLDDANNAAVPRQLEQSLEALLQPGYAHLVASDGSNAPEVTNFEANLIAAKDQGNLRPNFVLRMKRQIDDALAEVKQQIKAFDKLKPEEAPGRNAWPMIARMGVLAEMRLQLVEHGNALPPRKVSTGELNAYTRVVKRYAKDSRDDVLKRRAMTSISQYAALGQDLGVKTVPKRIKKQIGALGLEQDARKVFSTMVAALNAARNRAEAEQKIRAARTLVDDLVQRAKGVSTAEIKKVRRKIDAYKKELMKQYEAVRQSISIDQMLDLLPAATPAGAGAGGGG